ncbi:hypothetical protein [Sorangium sp. So ce204]|uniref:hypothetical protein n=1 Tax=Sorangium sp. So ce204 TaxID=3133288 RepID=UPI003F5DDF40
MLTDSSKGLVRKALPASASWVRIQRGGRDGLVAALLGRAFVEVTAAPQPKERTLADASRHRADIVL